MAKKINSYSWIHQLNQAALETKLLSEAKLFEQQMNPFERDIQYAGGDINTYRQIAAQKRRNLQPMDVDQDGDADAEDVKSDVQNNTIGDEDETSPIDPSMMARYPSIQKGMQMGSRHPDAIIDRLYSEIDADTERLQKIPNRPKYDVGHLANIARMLGQ